MFDSFMPKVNMPLNISAPKIDTSPPQPFRLQAISSPKSEFQNFSEVMAGIVKGLDSDAKKPDKLMAESLVNPNIDIHDVMLAVNQSELTLTVATQTTTKIIQGYEKIISMQV